MCSSEKCSQFDRNYVAPSAKTLTALIDEKIISKKKCLKDEILQDIEEAGTNTVSITCDGGTSGDKMKTKKNALTIHRTTNDFKIKSDTLDLMEAIGPQNASYLRGRTKVELQRFGYGSNWIINWTTDGAPNMTAARRSGNLDSIGLPTHHTTTCVDHTIHLCVEDSISKIVNLEECIKRVNTFVTHLHKSPLDRQKLLKVQEEIGMEKLCPIKGTQNRWFFKWSEAQTMCLMREAVDMFLERNPLDVVGPFDEDDWAILKMYVVTIHPIVKATKFLEGAYYPTACSVIPFLAQITSDLMDRLNKAVSRDEKIFVTQLLDSLKKRFPRGYKYQTPFNCLTFLDPRHTNLYALHEDVMKKIREDIKTDVVYVEMLLKEQDESSQVVRITSTSPSPQNEGSSDVRYYKRLIQNTSIIVCTFLDLASSLKS